MYTNQCTNYVHNFITNIISFERNKHRGTQTAPFHWAVLCAVPAIQHIKRDRYVRNNHMERTRRFRKSCKPLIFSQPRNDKNTTHRLCRGASEWVSMSNVVWFALWRHSAKVPSCSHMWYLWFMQIHPRILHSEHFPSPHPPNSNPILQSNMVITWKACRLDWNCVRQKERHRHSHRHQNRQTHTHRAIWKCYHFCTS